MSIMETFLRILNRDSKTVLNTKCYKERDYLTERLKTLTNELSTCIGYVEVLEKPVFRVNVRDVINGYNLLAADPEYVVVDDWKTLLTRIHNKLMSKYKYTREVFDCDDIALLYASVVSFSAYKSGLVRQPAFAIVWSDRHAFNLFIDINNKAWIYEPQSNCVIGELGKYKKDPYNVKRIWFMV